jgi:hypothetical protein
MYLKLLAYTTSFQADFARWQGFTGLATQYSPHGPSVVLAFIEHLLTL